MKIRFYKYSETDFTLEVKKWYGWKPLYMYDGAFSISMRFKSKEDGISYLRITMRENPHQVRILEYPTILVLKQIE